MSGALGSVLFPTLRRLTIFQFVLCMHCAVTSVLPQLDEQKVILGFDVVICLCLIGDRECVQNKITLMLDNDKYKCIVLFVCLLNCPLILQSLTDIMIPSINK